jgi:methionyl-tRNA formyltransferase
MTGAEPGTNPASAAPDAPVRVVFAGSGGFGREALRRLAAERPPVVVAGIVTAPPRPAGRRRLAGETPIATLGRELGIEPILTPARLREPEAIRSILDLRPDLLVVADYGQIVPAALLGLPFGSLNLHPSRLPRHRGASPIQAAILAGDADTAVTLIRMDAGLDTGPIVAVSEPVAIGTGETAPALEARLEVVAAELLEEVLPRWLRREIVPLAQPEDEEATMTRPLRREDGRLDPEHGADLLEREVRAYDPWPGTYLETADGERLAVLRAAVGASEPSDVTGRLVADGAGLALATADGRLRLLEVRPAGGRPMPSDALLRGRRHLVGADLRRADATMPRR